jgi:putative addiction module antidote
MNNRKFDVKLRKVGNSYVVTIPKDTVDRFNLEEGDYLAVDFDISEIKKKNKINNKEDKENDKSR